MKIVDTSMRHPVAVIIGTLGFIIFGLYALTQIGIERMPNVDIPVVMVRTTLEGASPALLATEGHPERRRPHTVKGWGARPRSQGRAAALLTPQL